jgi:hypothetical protein
MMNLRAIRPLRYSLAPITVLLAASMGLAQAAGATTLTRAFVLFVPWAQDHAFNAGVKAWEKCLHAHGSKHTALVYDAETGDLSRYLFLQQHSAWSEMDAHDAAGKACRPLFVKGVMPHVGQGYSEIAELNAKDTYMPGGDPDPAPMMWVNGYRIKPGQAPAFHDGVAHFAAAAAKIHWQGHFSGWDIDASGPGGENFVMVWPNRNWADSGTEPKPSAKDMMWSVYGQANAEAMRRKFMDSIAEQWSDAWSYDKDLSFVPNK